MKTKSKKSASPKRAKTAREPKHRKEKVAASDPIQEFKKLAEAVRLVVKDPKLVIDEKKTAVSLIHPDHPRKLVTWAGSRASLILRSPLWTKKDKGVSVTSLGEQEVRLKDAPDTDVVEKVVALLKRAGIKGGGA